VKISKQETTSFIKPGSLPESQVLKRQRIRLQS